MSVINTNVPSLIANVAIQKTNRGLSQAMEQMATGKRINSAKDDAAGLAISARMTSTVRGLDQAVRNANDGISMIQTAEGAMVEMTNMLQRMRELSVQSANDTYTDVDRGYLNLEFQQLKQEINRISENTEWNGKPILKNVAPNNGLYEFQVGAKSGQKISIQIPDMSLNPTVNSAVMHNLDADKPFSNQIMRLNDVEWAGSSIEFNDGNNSALISIPAISTNTGFITTNEEAANYILVQFNSSVSSIFGDKYNLSRAGGHINIEPSSSNPNPRILTYEINRAGHQTEISQDIYWRDGSTSFNVTAADLNSNTNTISVVSSGAMSIVSASNVSSKVSADASIEDLDEAINRISSTRANLGAVINRLTYAADNLQSISTNTSASMSRILDTDYAKATTDLARSQIISQAANAMLAQANQNPQNVLQLLQR
jgi:flagellin